MNTRIKEYSVGQLARLSGVTVRTLHHYGAIGLLRPAHIAANGYRTYGRAELLRLQEILFYRSFGLSLREIADLLADEADMVIRLRAHRDRLAAQAEKARRLLETLDRTIATLTKETEMQDHDLYEPFDTKTQTAYEEWLIETHGPEMAAKIATSKKAVDALLDGITGAMQELRAIEGRLVDAFAAGKSQADLASDLAAHRALMSRLWGNDCTPEAYAGLADIYLSYPDFIARYERLAPRFSLWLPAAMKAYAAEIAA